jgi:hypothetical protein
VAKVPLPPAVQGDDHDDGLLAGAAGEVPVEGAEEDEAGGELHRPAPQVAPPAEGEGDQAEDVADHVRPEDVLAEQGEGLGVEGVHFPAP